MRPISGKANVRNNNIHSKHWYFKINSLGMIIEVFIFVIISVAYHKPNVIKLCYSHVDNPDPCIFILSIHKRIINYFMSHTLS